MDSRESRCATRPRVDADGGARAQPARCGGVLPGGLLVFAAERAAEERFPGHWSNLATGSRPASRVRRSGCAASSRAAARRVISSARRAHVTCPTALRRARVVDGGVAAAAPVRSGREPDDFRLHPAGNDTRAVALCRLDRSHRRRRSAARAAASGRHRAQRRDHRVGLGGSEGLPARRGLHRPAQSDAQRQRAPLRRARVERRLSAGARSGRAPDQPGEADGARSGDAADVAADGPAIAVLGSGADLDEQEQRPQPDVRWRGPRVDHLGRATGRESGLLQGRFESSVGEALSGQQRVAAPRRLRPEDQGAHPHQHVLRHASPDVRRGRQQHAVDQRRRPGRRAG